MKRFVYIVLVTCMIFVLVACDDGEAPTEIIENKQVEETIQPVPNTVVDEKQEPEKSSEPEDAILPDESENWRIAIVSTWASDIEEIRTAERLKKRFGEDRIIHINWGLWAWDAIYLPSREAERIVEALAADPTIRAIVVGRSVISTNRGIEVFRNMREDVFILAAAMFHDAEKTSELADIVLGGDLLSIASAAVRTAYEMGASTFVNYLRDVQLENPVRLARRDAMREEAQRLGMEFVDTTVYHIKFIEELGHAEAMNKAREFVFEDVQRMVEQHGRDTAFFSADSQLQIPMIQGVFETGAIYAMPCCPTPFDGLPLALALFGSLESALSEFTDVEMVEIIREHLEAMGMLGRMASFPRSLDMMNIVVGVEYAVKWINGEVPREGIDMDVLHEIIERELGLPARLTLYEEDGVVLDNFVLINVDELMIF